MAEITLDYLESERKLIWDRIVDLQTSIKKKTSDYEKDAKQASKKCSEFRNKCESTKTEAEALFSIIQDTSNEVTNSNISVLIDEWQAPSILDT